MLPMTHTVCVGVLLVMAEPLPEFDKLWDYAHPDKTEAAFRALLPMARESGDRGYLVELLAQVGRAQGLQRKFPEAHRTLDEAEQLLTPETKVARVRYLLERGRAFNSGGQVEKARPLFLQAWDAARTCGAEDYAVDAAHMLGIVEPPEMALEWNERAIAQAEASQNPRVRRWLGPLYNNTGWTYYDKADYSIALTLLEKAQHFYQERGTPAQVPDRPLLRRQDPPRPRQGQGGPRDPGGPPRRNREGRRARRLRRRRSRRVPPPPPPPRPCW